VLFDPNDFLWSDLHLETVEFEHSLPAKRENISVCLTLVICIVYNYTTIPSSKAEKVTVMTIEFNSSAVSSKLLLVIM